MDRRAHERQGARRAVPRRAARAPRDGSSGGATRARRRGSTGPAPAGPRGAPRRRARRRPSGGAAAAARASPDSAPAHRAPRAGRPPAPHTCPRSGLGAAQLAAENRQDHRPAWSAKPPRAGAWPTPRRPATGTFMAGIASGTASGRRRRSRSIAFREQVGRTDRALGDSRSRHREEAAFGGRYRENRVRERWGLHPGDAPRGRGVPGERSDPARGTHPAVREGPGGGRPDRALVVAC